MKSLTTGLLLGLLGAASFVACSDAASDAPGKDAGTPDAIAPVDGGPTPADAATDADAAPLDASDARAPVALTPNVLTVAAGRHARLLNVVYAASGIYAVGQVGTQADAEDLATLIVKLTPAGALDTTFGGTGFVVHNLQAGKSGELARGIVVQSSGKIVVAGAVEHGLATEATRDIVVARLDANGALDPTFGTSGVRRLALTNGEMVQHFGLSRYESGNEDLVVVGARKQAGDAATLNEVTVIKLSGTDGAVLTAFGPNGDGTFGLPLATNASPRNATVLPDGKLLVAAYTNANGNKPIVFKLNADGTSDRSFATNGVFFPETGVPGLDPSGTAEAYGATLQGTKIVTTGYGREVSTQPALGWMSLRLDANGALDTTYGNGGHVFFGVNGQNANSRGMAVLSDKRVVLLGGASPPKPNAEAGTQSQHAAFVVLGENGAVDPTLTPDGPRLFDLGGPATGRAAHFFWSAAESPDHSHLVVVGLKGSLTANADAGIPGGSDEAVTLVVPLR